ncbi:TonB-dependent receptor [Telmatobacter sp. DSM 110680]|uniref:TonB-dependent receptor n=1 Tax=Telmatobacter sp. DSM 110680 TaxID=3036704 RepID=A0AAU7DEP1_9BACT
MTVKTLQSLIVLALSTATLVFGQANEGAVRLLVTDANGHTAEIAIHITSPANQFDKNLTTNPDGTLTVAHLPYGIYRIQIERPGFASVIQSVEIRSSTPTFLPIQLKLTPLTESVTVRTPESLLAIDQPGSVNMLGTEQIQSRLGSIPGRSLQDLVNSQPGWLYEGSAVLHPRGSEYQTQFVIDGIPLTDNRSPGFGPEIEADEVQSLSIYTAGIPAEYGRKLGGVIEVNTAEEPQPGLHGQIVLNGGSFASAGASGRTQYSRQKNSIAATAGGSRTDRYLNPVVPQNFSNTGTLGDFALRYEHTQDPDKLTFTLRREFSRYEIPNEIVQQSAGQRQTASNAETIGTAAWQHGISNHTFADARAMLRDKTSHFNSDSVSTPIAIFQRNDCREAYFNIKATFDRAHHEWKAGLDSDNASLRESLNYRITDPSQFAPGTASSFAFTGNRPDLEQSAFLEDTIHLHNATIAAGVRWDHYQLLANRQALEPRLSLSRYFPSALLVVHASYDRIFQTPSTDNILLSSSSQVASIDPATFLRLPVNPSTGDYYEIGASKDFSHHLRFDANYFRRFLSNFADDNQLQNTTIAFPIAFRKAIIYGLEGKLELPAWHGLSGFASYSYELGNVWSPVTGGLFLGSEASDAASLSGHFPNSQDQRNTLRTRARYQVQPRLWIAAGAEFDSGLPFEFDGDPNTVLAQYGPQVLSRLNFDRGRILPATLLSASAGASLHHSERFTTAIQADAENLDNTLDVLDFGGLFSGNAIGPPRSLFLRLTTTF